MNKDELLRWFLKISRLAWRVEEVADGHTVADSEYWQEADEQIRALIEGKKVSREEIIKWSEEGISISDILGYFDIEVIEPGVEVGE